MSTVSNIKAPGVWTSEVVADLVAQDVAKQALEKKEAWCRAQEQKCPIINDDGLNYTDLETQMGKPLSPQDFEKKLFKLNPDLIFEFNKNNWTKKALYVKQKGPKGEDVKEYICAYENQVMPEHSLMKRVLEEIPDVDYITGKARMVRSELPKHEVVPDSTSPLGKKVIFDPSAKRPGFKYRVVGFGEALRGWRTILLRLVTQNLITVDQAEKEFGSDNRAEWARWTGKRSQYTPTLW